MGALDIFAEHAVGGFIGNILTAFFAADYIAHLDGFSDIDGGWLNKNWVQLGYQIADSVSGAAYSFFGTCIILFVMNLIPACPCAPLRKPRSLVSMMPRLESSLMITLS